jgi:hypothetical protein
VEPVDALDAACRDHDVCWIWNGRHAVACNQAFGSTMRTLRRTFKESGQDRCANLALDMQMAASYVLPSASWWDRAEKVLWSPVTAVPGGDRAIGGGARHLPASRRALRALSGSRQDLSFPGS